MDKDSLCHKVIYRKRPFDFLTLHEALTELFCYMDVKLDVDLKRDEIDIKKLYYLNMDKISLENTYPALCEEWDYNKNKDINPKMVSYGSNDKVWWKCKTCNYEWNAMICDRTIKGKGCIKCARKRIANKLRKSTKKFESELEQINPKIILKEEYVNAHKKILFKCTICGYEWYASPANILKRGNCPNCKNKGKLNNKVTQKNKVV